MSKSAAADRYLRLGGPVPAIYHGDLAGLEQALSDTLQASRFLPGEIVYLMAVKGRQRTIIRMFRAGRELRPEREEDIPEA